MKHGGPEWKLLAPDHGSDDVSPPPWEGEMKSSVRIPAFPILHWHPVSSSSGPVSVDPDLGTAFFVTHTGLFLTAKHVVVSSAPDKPYSVLLIDEATASFTRLPVIRLSLHPVLDAAIGLVRVAQPVPSFRLGTVELKPDERVFTYGYSRTQVSELASVGKHGKSLAMNFRPAFYRGIIERYHPEGHGIAKGWPVYRHNADILGGISGGPLVRLSDSAVYGINCTGLQGYGTATAIAPLLDWPIDFLQGTTLRDLASEQPDLVTLSLGSGT